MSPYVCDFLGTGPTSRRDWRTLLQVGERRVPAQLRQVHRSSRTRRHGHRQPGRLAKEHHDGASGGQFQGVPALLARRGKWGRCGVQFWVLRHSTRRSLHLLWSLGCGSVGRPCAVRRQFIDEGFLGVIQCLSVQSVFSYFFGHVTRFPLCCVILYDSKVRIISEAPL